MLQAHVNRLSFEIQKLFTCCLLFNTELFVFPPIFFATSRGGKTQFGGDTCKLEAWLAPCTYFYHFFIFLIILPDVWFVFFSPLPTLYLTFSFFSPSASLSKLLDLQLLLLIFVKTLHCRILYPSLSLQTHLSLYQWYRCHFLLHARWFWWLSHRFPVFDAYFSNFRFSKRTGQDWDPAPGF